jgi:hypothetical protein
MVVSWKIYLPWREVMEKLKNVLSLLLGRAVEQKGRRWFVTGGSRKRVENTEHLNYLWTNIFQITPVFTGARGWNFQKIAREF